MLRFLRIRNLAVIEAVEVEFDDGFNVLTGETGAGKSILVEAVGLLLGARASPDLVRTGEALASIEAVFEDADGAELVVRRDITSQGRSRSYVNGALATAAALRDLSARVVELHGQHAYQTLLDPLTHLPLLDAHAGLANLVAQTGALWSSVRALRDQVERSRMDDRERRARLELIAFQAGEIEKVSPVAGEDEELAALRRVLANAEHVQQLCSSSYDALYDDEAAVLAQLGLVWKRVAELAAIDARFVPFAEQREGIKSQLEDLAFFLRSYAADVDASPERLAQVEDRLQAVERLKRKYGPTLDDVIERGRSLSRERALLTDGVDAGRNLSQELEAASGAYLEVARDLSRRRRGAAPEFARRVEGLLSELAMEKAQFEVRFVEMEAPPEQWGADGLDQAEFFVSPNPGEELRPLVRVASGGELSRLMLALQTLETRAAHGKTLIFDEVDAGIGGGVAGVVGARLGELGSRFQVLCITHLPQIAARGRTHFRIEKAVRGGRTTTRVDRLDSDGRVQEVARMIGGAGVTDAVLTSARELLAGGGERRKAKAKVQWPRNT